MDDGTLKQLTDSVESLQELARWIGGDRDQDTTADILNDYGVKEVTDDDDRWELAEEAIRESVLSIDTKIIKSIVFGTGGPHTEIEITLSADLVPLRGRAVGYWGSDTVERHISSDTVDALAEHFGLTAA